LHDGDQAALWLTTPHRKRVLLWDSSASEVLEGVRPGEQSKVRKSKRNKRKGVKDRIAEETYDELVNDNEELPDVSAPKITELFSLSDPAIRLPEYLREQYEKDKFFAQILREHSQFQNFVIHGLILMRDTSGEMTLRIADKSVNNREKVILSCVHSLSIHLFIRQTYIHLRRDSCWKDMFNDITKFVLSCPHC
jgi:hypothetical protein